MGRLGCGSVGHDGDRRMVSPIVHDPFSRWHYQHPAIWLQDQQAKVSCWESEQAALYPELVIFLQIFLHVTIIIITTQTNLVQACFTLETKGPNEQEYGFMLFSW